MSGKHSTFVDAWTGAFRPRPDRQDSVARTSRRPIRALVFVALLATVAGCSSSATPAPTTQAKPTPAPTSPSAPTTSPPAPSPSPVTGFAFDAESVAGYYVTLGYACSEPVPSALADGYFVTSCQLVDPEGRTRTIGLVVDPDDELADAYAIVAGAAGESILEPSAVLEPFAAFLGAMLGGPRGESLVTWLAGNLGEAYAETEIDALHVATYLKDDDHSTLFLEIANDAYLASPLPSPS